MVPKYSPTTEGALQLPSSSTAWRVYEKDTSRSIVGPRSGSHRAIAICGAFSRQLGRLVRADREDRPAHSDDGRSELAETVARPLRNRQPAPKGGLSLLPLIVVASILLSVAAAHAGTTGKKTKRELPAQSRVEFPSPFDRSDGPAMRGDYDRFSDVTLFTTSRIDIGDGLYLTPDIDFKGRKRPNVSDVRFGFVFTSNSPGWRFLRDHDVVIIADDERLEFSTPSHDGGVFDSGSVYEIVSVPMTAKTFARLAKATTIEGRLGRTEFRLAPETIEALKQLASCMHPDGFERCAALLETKP